MKKKKNPPNGNLQKFKISYSMIDIIKANHFKVIGFFQSCQSKKEFIKNLTQGSYISESSHP